MSVTPFSPEQNAAVFNGGIFSFQPHCLGECRARRSCSACTSTYLRVPVSFHLYREHKGKAYQQINPFGQLPAIDDDGYVLRDADGLDRCVATEAQPA